MKNSGIGNMDIFQNIKPFAQAQTFRKILNAKFGCSLDSSDIHWIFERYRLPYSVRVFNGAKIKYYKTSQVAELYYNGSLAKEIRNIMRNRSIPNQPITNTGCSFNGRSSNNDVSDELNYNNNENDMEKYSDYLINNVYESKNMVNKVIINENIFKSLVLESVKRILKESYHNSGAFSGNQVLTKLEYIIGVFEGIWLDYDSDTDDINDWERFVRGIIDVYNKSKELVHFKQYKIKELYEKYGDNEDMFFDDFLRENGIPNRWEFLDDYLDNIEQWEQIMPSPEEVYSMIKEFISWVTVHFEVKESEFIKQINKEKNWIISTLNKNIY